MAETHLFSVRRPREALGVIVNQSGIPLPSSAVKRSLSVSNLKENPAPNTVGHGRSQSSSRMSLAPARPPQPAFHRSSSGGNLQELGRSAQRPSSGYRTSYAPPMAATPQGTRMSASNIQRRSSAFSRPSNVGPPGSQSFFIQAALPSGIVADKRRLRDRAVQTQMATEIEQYLMDYNFSMETKHSLGPRALYSPTQKDFNMIFQWLYKRIDPGYVFLKSIDNEVPPILKQLRYPFHQSITKSQLTAVGQNWPMFLGMLHWLMQLVKMMESYGTEKYDQASAEDGVDVSGDRAIFRFLSSAYHAWISTSAEEDEEDIDKLLEPYSKRLAQDFERGNEHYSEELSMLEAENKALQSQIEELEQSMPDLGKANEHCKILESDLQKFEDYKISVADKLRKYSERNRSLNEEIENYDKQIAEVLIDRNQLQQAVDRQGISTQDIDRMNSERERLQSGLEGVRTQFNETTTKIKERETDASDKLSALETLVRKFNALCYDVGLRDQEFELSINLNDNTNLRASQLRSSYRGGDRLLADAETGYHPGNILNLDLRKKMKNHVAALRKEIAQRRINNRDVNEENRKLLYEISEAIDDRRQEVEGLEHRVRSAEEEHEKTKDAMTTQKLQSDQQIEKMEKLIIQLRADQIDELQIWEQKAMNMDIEYEQMTIRANAIREELHTGIERLLGDVIKFKIHIQEGLENYDAMVETELQTEKENRHRLLEDVKQEV